MLRIQCCGSLVGCAWFLVSAFKMLLCGGGSVTLKDRSKGEFVRQVAEPARTHRLLRRPFRLFQSEPEDALDALRIVWMSRATGNSFHGIFYDIFMFTAMLAIAALNGLAPSLQSDTAGAMVQAVFILVIQWLFVFYMTILRPSVDRLDNAMITMQFAFEGMTDLPPYPGKRGWLCGEFQRDCQRPTRRQCV